MDLHPIFPAAISIAIIWGWGVWALRPRKPPPCPHITLHDIPPGLRPTDRCRTCGRTIAELGLEAPQEPFDPYV